ncbi:cytochrome p450 domain-containing protein [Apiospora aurea]|uniref:Cytochrome p450 domain-containing protein n=1 Tax=Apiospora aurea TaxID=335848 RepID=A0ABR1QXY0_9PEZI
MSQQIDVFLRLLRQGSHSSEPQNMTDRCQRLGFDTVGHLAFGCDLKLQTDEANRVMIRMLTMAKMRVATFMHFPALQSLDFILTSLPSKDGKEFRRIIREVVNTRVAEGDRGQHGLYAVMGEHTKPGGIYDGILWPEAISFMTAGGTPPATTLSALFFYLSRYPECYEKLANEIRSQFSSAQEIQGGPALAGCKYLRACIDESLRMAPPSLTTPWREQAADDPERGTAPLVIDGHVVPPGTQFGVNLYALHHNEEYFPDAFTFKPERWLESDDPGDKQHRAFAPFLVGPRSCAGRAMAYLEVSLTMAKTLWYFDFDRAPGALGEVGQGTKRVEKGFANVNEFQILDMFNANHDGPYLVFRPRGHHCAELA